MGAAAVVPLVISAGQAVIGSIAKKKQEREEERRIEEETAYKNVEAKKDYDEALLKYTEDSAEQKRYNEALDRDAIRQYGEMDKVEADVVRESYSDSLQAQRDFLKAKSQVVLQASASGTQGQSVDLAITDLGSGLEGSIAKIAEERESELDRVNSEAENIRYDAANRKDRRKLKKPTFSPGFSPTPRSSNNGLALLSTALDIGGKAYGAYSNSKSANMTNTNNYGVVDKGYNHGR